MFLIRARYSARPHLSDEPVVNRRRKNITSPESTKMLPTRRLLQACRVTLFTRKNCGLCIEARTVLSDVWDSRPFVFNEIDIIQPEFKGWRDLYDMDVPVVGTILIASPPLEPR